MLKIAGVKVKFLKLSPDRYLVLQYIGGMIKMATVGNVGRITPLSRTRALSAAQGIGPVVDEAAGKYPLVFARFGVVTPFAAVALGREFEVHDKHNKVAVVGEYLQSILDSWDFDTAIRLGMVQDVLQATGLKVTTMPWKGSPDVIYALHGGSEHALAERIVKQTIADDPAQIVNLMLQPYGIKVNCNVENFTPEMSNRLAEAFLEARKIGLVAFSLRRNIEHINITDGIRWKGHPNIYVDGNGRNGFLMIPIEALSSDGFVDQFKAALRAIKNRDHAVRTVERRTEAAAGRIYSEAEVSQMSDIEYLTVKLAWQECVFSIERGIELTQDEIANLIAALEGIVRKVDINHINVVGTVQWKLMDDARIKTFLDPFNRLLLISIEELSNVRLAEHLLAKFVQAYRLI
ncbi:hypothetical protein HZC34_00745 [Candidatus Saganbacteria bacterium]|nr:hypothetical protein [Candidatus Saganbacteria bacterium]